MGRHCEGFPGPNLRKIVEESNIFLQLKGKGKKVKFADAYLVDSVDELRLRRFKSVTTVMALTVPESVSTVEDLMSDSAVMQDLTRETIQDRYPDIPVIPPQRAAEHLFAVFAYQRKAAAAGGAGKVLRAHIGVGIRVHADAAFVQLAQRVQPVDVVVA